MNKIKYLGYANNVKGYRLWDITTHKVIVSKDVMILQPADFKEQENLVWGFIKSLMVKSGRPSVHTRDWILSSLALVTRDWV